MFKKIVTLSLKLLAKIRLKRMRPLIIGVTGSFGKTSTKEAIYTILKGHYPTLQSEKSLNTEIGMSLAILQQPSGFNSPLKWMKILACAKWNAFFGKNYTYIVLEYGVDKPGDMDALLAICKPDIAVVTHIAAVHQAEGQFKNEEEVFQEKKKLAAAASTAVILNHHDVFLKKLEGTLKTKTYWFNGTDISVSSVGQTAHGIHADIHYKGEKLKAEFPAVGGYHMDIFQPALLIGALKDIALKDGMMALQKMKLPPGRMSLIEGINGSTILDSTYNASPETVIAALNVLKTFPAQRRIAVLGNMNELGEKTTEAHERVAAHMPHEIDMVITVGDSASAIAPALLKNGFNKGSIHSLHTAQEAAAYLKQLPLKKGDAILLKGSQNKVRLERTVEMIMAHPKQARDLLCRQEPEWKSIT